MKIRIRVFLTVIFALAFLIFSQRVQATNFSDHHKKESRIIFPICRYGGFPCHIKCANQNTLPDEQSDVISVKIINKGAPASVERNVQNLLASQEKLQITTGRGTGPESEEYLVFFKEEKFRLKAQEIAQLLREKESIFSYARIASTTEEKSADIVIILGKNKEAPPN
jgi:hypothetical protein